MKKILTAIIAFILCFSAISCSSKTIDVEYINPYDDTYSIRYDTNSKADIEIDFSQKDGSVVQNIKKIDMFSPTWDFIYGETMNYASLEQLYHLQQLKSEAFRIDMVFGGGGIANNPTLNSGLVKSNNSWTRVNSFINAMEDNNVIPYLIMLGIPNFAQKDGGTNISVPNEEEYRRFCRETAEYFAENDVRLIYETWNEPDLNAYSYWTDGMPTFIDTSIIQTVSLKEGNPDAYVAELGLCWPVTFCRDYSPQLEGTLWDYYMKKTAEANNHIDAFTWHYYGDSLGRIEGCSQEQAEFSYYKKAVRDAINRDNDKYDLHTMTQHVTEFSMAATGSGMLVQTGLIPNLYDTIDEVLNSTDISRVSWTSYFMSEFSLINPYSYQKSPAFYVLWSYGRLPLGVAQVEANEMATNTFGWRTGVDNHRAGAIIYNKTLNDSYYVTSTYKQNAKDSRNVSVSLKNIPFDAKTMKVYLIDNEHVSYVTSNSAPYLIMDLNQDMIKNGDVTLDLKIPGNAAFYIEIEDGSGIAGTDEKNNLSDHIVRKDYYYDERNDLLPYSDIYENSFDVTMGMLNNQTGKTAINVTLDDMNEFLALQLDWEIWGEGVGAGSNKALGVRIDYMTDNGYASASEYYWRNYKQGFTYTGWGTGETADISKQFGTSPIGSYQIPLMQNAPIDWNGRIMITYFMEDAGTNTSINIRTTGIK